MNIRYKSLPMGGMRPVADIVAANFQQAMHLHQRGHLAQAQLIYERVLQAQPKHCHALHLLGVIAFQTGNHERAAELIGRAIEIDPNHAAFYCNRGNALLKLRQFDAAVASYDEAIRMKSDFADAHSNRGVALAELLQFEAAVASYDEAIAVNPNYAEAFYNRGMALQKLGQAELAIGSYGAAIALRPDFADAYCAQAISHIDRGRLDEAGACYRQALLINPDSSDAYVKLAHILVWLGKPEDAIANYIRALAINETTEAKTGFARCVRRLEFENVSPEICALVIRAISESWTRPAHLYAAAVSIVKLNLEIRALIDKATEAWPTLLTEDELFGAFGLTLVANDPMIQCILEFMPASSIEFERFLTQTRHVLLDIALRTKEPSADKAIDKNDTGDRLLLLFAAVARQCFINEYVFSVSDAELLQVEELRAKLISRLNAESFIPAIWIAAVSAYSSLASLPSINTIVEQTWPEPIGILVKQQVLEPAAERAYSALIPRLTPISDNVSLLVQTQYEENPYPRWGKTSCGAAADSVDTYLRAQFPHASFQPLSKGGDIDILIAGCGTGQQSIDSAQLFPHARVLAVDLSLPSLGYAKRKTEELGIVNINYAQADIMELRAINQRFDVIESVGVLHHLAKPLAGWQILLGLLEPGGFMRLGLYSELARQSVVRGRDHIARHGYAATAADIRRCRQDMMSDEYRSEFKGVLSTRDFFALSECRDLLFHVQEHRFTVLQIKDALKELGLRFIGFSLETNASNQYCTSFPDDLAQTNLDNWHLFETESPTTFAGMYQFWTQKIG